MNGSQNGKKFRDERVVQLIDKCITLKEADTKKNNEILKKILDNVLKAMKEHDDFFRDHFQEPVFVGSFYKGTKVGKPEEFDVDLIIKLPMKYETITFERDLPGFTKLKTSPINYTAKSEVHRKILSKWITPEGYLNQDEFRQSMESIFKRAMDQVPKNHEYEVNVKKSGPAFTLAVVQRNSLKMSVDLVPVLEFAQSPPLLGNFGGEKWYAVPKPIKSGDNVDLHWRMSFYKYEKNMLKKNGELKPVIRMVKKLRDKYDWKLIPSYHIETLFMHHMKDMEKNPNLQKMSRTELFIHMLNRLKNVCEEQRLANFWDNSHNLIDAKENQLASIIGLLAKIIKQVNDDPMMIAEHVLTKQELIENDDELKSIRNSRDSGKLTEQQTARRNEVQNEPDKSRDANLGNVTSPPFVTNLMMMMGNVLASNDNATNGASSNSMANDNGNSEIMDMLKIMHSELVSMKDSISLLSRRVASVEDKVDSLLSRFNTQDPATSALSATDFLYDRLSSSSLSHHPGNWTN